VFCVAGILGCDAVNSVCCDDDDELCTDGAISTCDAYCAAQVLPVQAACADFLSQSGMETLNALIAGAAAACDSQSGH
jgi:hypothetical protein